MLSQNVSLLLQRLTIQSENIQQQIELLQANLVNLNKVLLKENEKNG